MQAPNVQNQLMNLEVKTKQLPYLISILPEALKNIYNLQRISNFLSLHLSELTVKFGRSISNEEELVALEAELNILNNNVELFLEMLNHPDSLDADKIKAFFNKIATGFETFNIGQLTIGSLLRDIIMIYNTNAQNPDFNHFKDYLDSIHPNISRILNFYKVPEDMDVFQIEMMLNNLQTLLSNMQKTDLENKFRELEIEVAGLKVLVAEKAFKSDAYAEYALDFFQTSLDNLWLQLDNDFNFASTSELGFNFLSKLQRFKEILYSANYDPEEMELFFREELIDDYEAYSIGCKQIFSLKAEIDKLMTSNLGDASITELNDRYNLLKDKIDLVMKFYNGNSQEDDILDDFCNAEELLEELKQFLADVRLKFGPKLSRTDETLEDIFKAARERRDKDLQYTSNTFDDDEDNDLPPSRASTPPPKA